MKKVIGLLLISFLISSCGHSYKDGYQRGYLNKPLYEGKSSNKLLDRYLDKGVNKYRAVIHSDYERGYFNGRQDREVGSPSEIELETFKDDFISKRSSWLDSAGNCRFEIRSAERVGTYPVVYEISAMDTCFHRKDNCAYTKIVFDSTTQEPTCYGLALKFNELIPYLIKNEGL